MSSAPCLPTLQDLTELFDRLGSTYDARDLLGVLANSLLELCDADDARAFSPDNLPHEGLLGCAALEGQLINLSSPAADERFRPDADGPITIQTGAALIVPVASPSTTRVHGLVVLTRARSDLFEPPDVRLAQIAATRCLAELQRQASARAAAEAPDCESSLTRFLRAFHLIDFTTHPESAQAATDICRDIVTNVLPRSLPACDGYEFAVFSRPADETGGDTFDLISPESGDSPTLVVLADATGHGLPAALHVTHFLAALHLSLRFTRRLDQLLDLINQQLITRTPDGRFITAFLGELDTDAHVMHFQSAAQGPILHMRRRIARIDTYYPTTHPLGVCADLMLSDPVAIAMEPGDAIALLTDGFFETFSPDGRMLEHRGASEILAHCFERSAQDTLFELFRATDLFSQNAVPRDDLTAMIIRRKPLDA